MSFTSSEAFGALAALLCARAGVVLGPDTAASPLNSRLPAGALAATRERWSRQLEELPTPTADKLEPFLGDKSIYGAKMIQLQETWQQHEDLSNTINGFRKSYKAGLVARGNGITIME